MKKIMMGFLLSLTISGPAWAGCDPCICGNGGGLPPPTGCGYGPWAGHKLVNNEKPQEVEKDIQRTWIEEALDIRTNEALDQDFDQQ